MAKVQDVKVTLQLNLKELKCLTEFLERQKLPEESDEDYIIRFNIFEVLKNIDIY